MAGTTESGSGYNQQIVVVLGTLTEGDIIRDDGLREDIKCSARFHYGVAHLPEALCEQVPVCLIDRDIRSLICIGSTDPLEEAGSAEMEEERIDEEMETAD